MLTEAHCAVLRMDPKGYSAAYRQHAALGPGPMGTLPAPEHMASVIANCEVHIEKELGSCTPYECVHLILAIAFLARDPGSR
jgi:hypothetical protein